jgi:ABC-type bacteriocin/lantibiotic exporter with double-glycine peptidase domain
MKVRKQHDSMQCGITCLQMVCRFFGREYSLDSLSKICFARRWFLLRISMRINISLVSDFFIKLLKLPMSFFDTKLMGDLMQRMNDHSRVNNFLTQQTLNITFAMLTFVVFSVVLFIYNKVVFAIFLLGSILYGRCLHAGHQRGCKNIGISNGFGKGYNRGTERDSASLHPSLEPEPFRGII